MEEALQLVADEHANGDESRLDTDSYHVKGLIQEKFAELIVRETMQVVANHLPSNQYLDVAHAVINHYEDEE